MANSSVATYQIIAKQILFKVEYMAILIAQYQAEQEEQEELEQMLAELGQLSDEEAQRLLDQEG